MQIQVGSKLMNVQVLIGQQQLSERVAQLAIEINNVYGSQETLVVIVVLHGALIFAADLVRHFEMPTEFASIRLKSYEGLTSSGKIELLTSLPDGLEGKNVIIVEDIVDSGKSMDFLLKKLSTVGVKSVRIATLLDKPEAHAVPIKPDFIGFSIGRNFVIGYGLDLDGKYRNLPYVAELVECQ
jgi:hypoxanthine phosphoribosyltransferase